ncbi:universal stress protein [Caballeronia grimmiae]|uniref:universal stress protein n=1 Tax=Caballeronia grimmiae TaxID=1071679 RepID=UPI0038BD204A
MAHCPMLVLPQQPAHKRATRPHRLLCAVDGSPASLESLRAAFMLAEPGAYVQAIYVVDRSSRGTDSASRATLEDAFLDEGRAHWRKRAPPSPNLGHAALHVRCGNGAHAG